MTANLFIPTTKYQIQHPLARLWLLIIVFCWLPLTISYKHPNKFIIYLYKPLKYPKIIFIRRVFTHVPPFAKLLISPKICIFDVISYELFFILFIFYGVFKFQQGEI